MPAYIGLAKFTTQGLRGVKETVARADAAREMASRFGVRLESIHWTQGQYDIVLLVEAPDDTAIAAYSLAVAAAGNVSFETLRAFSREEMTTVLKQLP